MDVCTLGPHTRADVCETQRERESTSVDLHLDFRVHISIISLCNY